MTARHPEWGKFLSVFLTDRGAGSVVAGDNGLLEVFLPAPGRFPEGARQEALGVYPGIVGENDLSRRAADQLRRYFLGEASLFDFDIDNRIFTPFQWAVCRLVARIPAGEVKTYGEVAREAGRPSAARGVGNAMATNPLPVIIPCHRVVGSGGELTGYSAPGGLTVKRELLLREGVGFRAGRCMMPAEKSGEIGRLCTESAEKR